MKVYTVTESIDYSSTNILGVYATAVRAKEACWQEAEAYPYLKASLESTEDGNTLSIRVGSTVFGVDEHEVVAA
jgi:hypothetical protein